MSAITADAKYSPLAKVATIVRSASKSDPYCFSRTDAMSHLMDGYRPEIPPRARTRCEALTFPMKLKNHPKIKERAVLPRSSITKGITRAISVFTLSVAGRRFEQ